MTRIPPLRTPTTCTPALNIMQEDSLDLHMIIIHLTVYRAQPSIRPQVILIRLRARTPTDECSQTCDGTAGNTGQLLFHAFVAAVREAGVAAVDLVGGLAGTETEVVAVDLGPEGGAACSGFLEEGGHDGHARADVSDGDFQDSAGKFSMLKRWSEGRMGDEEGVTDPKM